MLTKLKISFLKFQIKLLLKQYHLQKNSSGRKRKILDDEISSEYKTSHLKGNFPGKSLGD
jgi:hypothetical protein